MRLAFFYDTETSGMPDWKNPSDAPQQPHIVEFAGLAVDVDSHEIVHSLNMIVKPDGWDISTEVSDIHGITHERAMDVGLPESAVLEAALHLWRACDVRVGYNEMFDARILRIAIKRYRDTELADAFKAAPAECAMRQAQKIRGGQVKNLGESLLHFTGKTLDGAHSAYNDAAATASLYWALQPLRAAIAV